jgi:hypothetical protein
MKAILNWFKITWKRLKSQTPPYFLGWGFFMLVFSGFITLMDNAKAGEYLPEFFTRYYSWIKFIYSGCASITAFLATKNIMLSKATTTNYEEIKPQIKMVEKQMEDEKSRLQEEKEKDIFNNMRRQ